MIARTPVVAYMAKLTIHPESLKELREYLHEWAIKDLDNKVTPDGFKTVAELVGAISTKASELIAKQNQEVLAIFEQANKKRLGWYLSRLFYCEDAKST